MKRKISTKLLRATGYFLYAIVFGIWGALGFLFYFFGSVSVEQVLFHTLNPVSGTNPLLLRRGIAIVITSIVVGWAVFYTPSCFVRATSKWNKILEEKWEDQHFFQISFAFFLLVLTIAWVGYRFSLYSYIFGESGVDELIIDHGVFPHENDIKFDKRNNLIVVYMESIENSYHNVDAFGEDLMPGLSKLKDANLSFTGQMQVRGTEFTVAGTFSSLYALPFSVSCEGKSALVNTNLCVPKILVRNGYSTHFIMGSSGAFTDTRKILEGMGVQDFQDRESLQVEYGKLNEETRGSIWGYNDRSLFEIAKKRLSSIAEEDAPFFFGIATIDTHQPDEFFDKAICVEKHHNFLDIISCADYQITNFVNWVLAQPWAKNTTILLMGDHLAPKHYVSEKTYDLRHRSIENIWVNPVRMPVNTQRSFTTIDIAPTMLEAIGANLPQHAFNLGVSLMDGHPTVLELEKERMINKLGAGACDRNTPSFRERLAQKPTQKTGNKKGSH